MKKQRIENLIKETLFTIEEKKYQIERYKEELYDIDIFTFRFEPFEIKMLQKLDEGNFLKQENFLKTTIKEEEEKLKKWEIIYGKLEIVKKLQIKNGGLK